MKKPTLALTLAALFCAHVSVAQAEVFLGPSNPTLDGGEFDPYYDQWNFGGTAGHDSEGGAVADTGLLRLGSDNPDGGDFRAESFSLGQAANGAEELSISFQFQFTEEVKAGDNLRVGLRFNDASDDFKGEHNVYIGSTNGDTSLLNEWQTFTQGGIIAHAEGLLADIRVTANHFGDDDWTSGTVKFDDFAVSTIPEPGTYALIGGFLALGAVLLRRKFFSKKQLNG